MFRFVFIFLLTLLPLHIHAETWQDKALKLHAEYPKTPVPIPPKKPPEFQQQSDITKAQITMTVICFRNLTLFLNDAHKKGFNSIIAGAGNSGDNFTSVLMDKQKNMVVVITKPDGLSCIIAQADDAVIATEKLLHLFGEDKVNYVTSNQ